MRRNGDYRIFAALRALRAFEKRELAALPTALDRDLACQIGYSQSLGQPLGVKQILLLDIGSVASVQRRLRRLRDLGLVRFERSARDRRAIEVTLDPRLLNAFARCAREFPGLCSAYEERVEAGLRMRAQGAKERVS